MIAQEMSVWGGVMGCSRVIWDGTRDDGMGSVNRLRGDWRLH